MKKYVLRNEKTSEHFTTDDPSIIVDKLIRMESGGTSINDLTVMVIDTEKYPPVTEPAKAFLEKNRIK